MTLPICRVLPPMSMEQCVMWIRSCMGDAGLDVSRSGLLWQEPQMKAIFNAVPEDRLVVLDLNSEMYPVWQRTEAFYGEQWIWNMLHNFGGRVSLYGVMERVANDPAAALHNPNAGKMCGIGLTMEAIEQNPAIYALMLEMYGVIPRSNSMSGLKNMPDAVMAPKIRMPNMLGKYSNRRFTAINHGGGPPQLSLGVRPSRKKQHGHIHISHTIV